MRQNCCSDSFTLLVANETSGKINRDPYKVCPHWDVNVERQRCRVASADWTSRCFNKLVDYRHYIRYKNKLGKLQTKIFFPTIFISLFTLFYSHTHNFHTLKFLPSHLFSSTHKPIMIDPHLTLLGSRSFFLLIFRLFPYFSIENKFAPHTDADVNDYTPEKKNKEKISKGHMNEKIVSLCLQIERKFRKSVPRDLYSLFVLKYKRISCHCLSIGLIYLHYSERFRFHSRTGK